MVPAARTTYCIVLRCLRPRGRAPCWAGAQGASGPIKQEWGRSDRDLGFLGALLGRVGRILTESSASFSLVRFYGNNTA